MNQKKKGERLLPRDKLNQKYHHSGYPFPQINTRNNRLQNFQLKMIRVKAKAHNWAET